MLHHFSLISWSAPQEMFEVQFHKTVGTVGFQEQSPIGIGLCQRGHKSLNCEITVHEESVNGWQNIQLHHVTIAENLAIGRCQDVLCMACIQF